MDQQKNSETVAVEIKSIGGAVLYTAQVPTSTPSGLRVRDAMDRAAKSRAYLGGADLRGAYLGGADLRRAYLGGAYLGGADLGGAKLTDSLSLVGDRPVLTIGPIGSRCDVLTAYLTDGGVYVRAGCFFGTLDGFAAAVESTHGDTLHGDEYSIAILMIKAHARLWTPEATK